MFCLECGCDMVLSNDPITEVYRGESIVVEGIEHYVCPKCGEYAVSAESSKKLSHEIVCEYAKTQGLLTPDQIAAVRQKTGLSQSDFQKMIGVTGVTVSRWETGKAQQSKLADNFLRVIDKFGCVAPELMQRAEVGRYAKTLDESVCVFRQFEDKRIPKVTFAGDEW